MVTIATLLLLCSSSFAVADLEKLKAVEVTYVTLPGWKRSIGAVTSYGELPENCKKYVKFIEEYLKVAIEWIGVGPERESMIRKDDDV
jgi:adenylosuccinate synthase